MTNFVCAVADCKSDSRLKKNKNPSMKDVKGWAKFPSAKKEARRRRLWEQKCRRPIGWKATRNQAICSLHFIDWGENGPSSEHPDPVLFAYNEWGKNCFSNIARKKNNLQCLKSQSTGDHDLPHPSNHISSPNPEHCSTQTLQPAELITIQDVQEWPEVEVVCDSATGNDSTPSLIGTTDDNHMNGDHTYASSSYVTPEVDRQVHVGVQVNTLPEDNPQIEVTVQEREAARDDTSRKGVFRQAFIQKILRNDKSVRKYTGLKSQEFLDDLFEVIMKRVKDISYWKRARCSQDENTPPRSVRSQRKRELSHFEEYVMTLVFIRLGYDYHVLGDFFDVSKSVVSSVIITWINILYAVLADWIKWPSAEQVRTSLPKDFPTEYADTRTILDCTEFFTVRPSNLSAMASTYSMYKHHNTLKVLLGITPTGLITFVSSVYGGNTSDRHIFETEFLDKLEPGNAVMVDRGFNVGDLVLQRSAKLHMPPFTRKAPDGSGKMLNQTEIAKTRSIACLRIHVERAIQRMKTFQILNKIDNTLWSLSDYIVVIVAVFSNMLPPLVPTAD